MFSRISIATCVFCCALLPLLLAQSLQPITGQGLIYSMAVHDVSTAYIREMGALGIHPSKADQLISMPIHGVSVEYVKELKNAGYNSLTPDHLVSMRIHGVTVEFVRDLKSMGYNAST